MDIVVKALIVYESKYGNTRLVGETIAQGMMETEGAEATLVEVQEVNLNKATDYDLILIGSPNHVGGPTRGIMKFLDELGKLDLKGKMGCCFRHLSGRRLREGCEEDGEENRRKSSWIEDSGSRIVSKSSRNERSSCTRRATQVQEVRKQNSRPNKGDKKSRNLIIQQENGILPPNRPGIVLVQAVLLRRRITWCAHI
jgi:flavodoxin